MNTIWNICAIGLHNSQLTKRRDINWTGIEDFRLDAAIVDGLISEATWADLSRELPPLLPLAALGSVPSFLYPDFVCADLTGATLDAMLAALAPIRLRAAEIPSVDMRGQGDMAVLAMLSLAHTRDRTIEAERDPATPSTIVYPLLSGRPSLRDIDLRAGLESLASRDLLQRRFAARVLTCSSCGSGRLSAFEACVECGSADLFDEAILHHYRCGFQDAESRFVSGHALVCPKCRRELRHIGVDYGRPGTMVRCRPCGQVMSEPQPSFGCLDCQTTQRGEQTRPVDWHHYDLTERGAAVARTTAMPGFDMTVLAATFPRLRSTNDFLLLVREQLLVAQRFARPGVIAVIGIGNLAAMERDQGPRGAVDAVKLFTQIVVESLRETDLAAMPSAETLVVAMPETEPAVAAALFEQIRLRAAEVLATVPEITIHVVAGAETAALLESLAS